MSEYKIEHNVPLPKSYLKYSSMSGTISQMEVGDSFVAEDSTANTRNSIYVCARRFNRKMSIRTIGGGKIRAWRIK